MGKRRKGSRIALFVGVGALATVIGLGAYAAHGLRSLELKTVDTRFAIRGSTGQAKDVVVVAIDDRTFIDFHEHRSGVQAESRASFFAPDPIPSHFPFPRSLYAKVIDQIAAGHPRAIGIDIEFTDRTTDDQDLPMITSVADAGYVLRKGPKGGPVEVEELRTVLSTTEVDPETHTTGVFGGLPLRQIGAVAANGSMITDPDGVMRHVNYSIDGLTTFSVATAAVAQNKPVPKPRTGSEWIDYGGVRAVKNYSFGQVYLGKVPPSTFGNKIVILGLSAPSFQDVHSTSASGSELMPGPEVQANAIETALHGFPLRSAPAGLNVLLIILLGMLPAVLIRLRAFYTPVVAVAGGTLFAVAAQLLFNHGLIIAFTYPLLALALAAVGSLVVYYVLEAFERALTRDVFARFVPEAVVDQVLARTGGELRLGGEKVFGTAMFTDLRGFTTFSETLPADEVIGLLNRYLGIMSDVVLAHGGTLVTYTGDGMMAVFGAPLPQADHADRALACAREMLEVRLPAFNDWLHDQGHEYSFKMGVGLNSGDFMSGNVGSQQRLEYTAIGDTINTCSRIEGMTKGTPYALYLSGSTKDALLDPPDDMLYIDEMPVRGRAHTIPIWSLSSKLILKENWESEVAPKSPVAPEPEPAAEPAGAPA